MKDRDSLTFVEDMIDAITKILTYIETVEGRSGFMSNEMVIDAVTRNYEIIGEASNNIPQSLRDKYPEIPWRQMYGLRNFAVHEYHIIDPAILWEIAEDHLTQNKTQLESLLKTERVCQDEEQ